MIFQIDQSGKIEQTNLDTVIALSNKIKYAILLKKRVKRILQSIFRRQNRQRMFVYTTFAALVAIILKETCPKEKIIIDNEYPGHEDILKSQVTDYLLILKIKKFPVFEFGLIGKASNAHKLAAKVVYKKKKADRIVNLEEILKIVFNH